MAASYTLTDPRFPNGATVYANAVGEDDPPAAAVVADGSATFTGLREFWDYVAHARIGSPDVDGAGSELVRTSFTTDGGASAEIDEDSLSPALKATLVCGRVHDGANYPERKAGFAFNHWVGPSEPPDFEDGDVWTPTV